MGYSRDEQETVLVRTADSEYYEVYSTIPSDIRWFLEHGDVEIVEEDNGRPIAVRGKVHKKQISFRKLKTLSEEHKEKLRQNIKIARSKLG